MDRYQITFKTWDKVAQRYQDRFMDYNLYDDTYDAFCDLIPTRNARIFEVGCGPGNVTRSLLTKRPDFQIEAIDIAPNMIELAQTNNPSAHFRVMDCREIDAITERFDGILCGFILPYLSKADCAKLVKDCEHLLKPGGVFYFSAIEGDYENSGFEAGSDPNDKMYVYYHQEAFLQDLLIENGFELAELYRKPFTKADGATSTHLIFITRKPEQE
jgi:2-polyprenyl-3-methyl-5-hydroxy-6-metoxy-1,4-benzoquinol methylase